MLELLSKKENPKEKALGFKPRWLGLHPYKSYRPCMVRECIIRLCHAFTLEFLDLPY